MPVSANGQKTIELSDLFARRVQTVKIQITEEAGDTFSVTYKPDAFTKKLQADLAVAPSEDAMAVLLTGLIQKWDLTVGGEPYAVTAENLEALGLPLMTTISSVLMDDFNNRLSLGKTTLTASPEDSSGI